MTSEIITDPKQRLDICKSCEFFTSFNRCSKCGCIMPVKVRFKSQNCPINKWNTDMLDPIKLTNVIVNVYDPVDQNTTAEDNAMIASLCSRSLEPFNSFMDRAKKFESGSFMSKFNVGFGHKSIADSGSFSIYYEGISLLAAKAIENSQLFNGQESSTRYIPFADREYYDTRNKDASEICNRWLNFVRNNFDNVVSGLSKTNPELSTASLELKATDILRGYLPAGIKTNVAWHTTLSHAKENILFLLSHPLPEVRGIGQITLDKCIARYPSTFKREKFELSEYQQTIGANYMYADNNPQIENNKVSALFHPGVFDDEELHAALFSDRGKFEKLPKMYDFYGDIRWDLVLDYGSFRDLQRHRNSDIYQPILDGTLGFNPWYHASDQLVNNDLKREADELITSQFRYISDLEDSHELPPYEMQYVYPQGTNISVSYRSNLNQIMYICELRSSPKVHPIFRNAVLSAIGQLENILPFIDIKYEKDDAAIRKISESRVNDTITELSGDKNDG